jgi:heterodisulfide reductase subunit D
MAGVDVTVMREEVCCGSPLLRSGQPELALELARKNFEAMKAVNPDLMITSCAGCCRTWKMDYPEMVGEKLPFKVMHSSEYLSTLIRAGRIKLKSYDKTVTYHDPCHLGRGLGMYAPSRDALKAIKGIDYVEMANYGKTAKCCGAGGGFRSLDRKLSVEIAKNRVNEAKEAGAEVLVTACSFCSLNFKEAGGIEVIGLPALLRRLVVSGSEVK